MTTQDRLLRLYSAMKTAGMDALALNPGPSLTYLTGLRFHLMERPVVALFTPEAPPTLVLPELEAGKAKTGQGEMRLFTYDDDPSHWQVAFDRAAKESGLEGKTLGVEPLRMRLLEKGFLEAALPHARFISAQPLLSSLRMRKEPAEIESMRTAVQIAQRGFQAMLPSVKIGMSERQLAAELTLQLLRAGSDPELPFFPIIASGPNGANPHAAPSERRLQPGDLVVVDWGAAYQDYFSDLTRTLAVGEVEPEMGRIAQITIEANAAGRAAGRPGMAIGEVDRLTREVIEDSGYGSYFIHRTGHGLGMEDHEEPYVFGGNPLVLQLGMTYTVEPGIYLPGRGGVRIEDNVVVTESGAETLSDLPRQLYVVG